MFYLKKEYSLITDAFFSAINENIIIYKLSSGQRISVLSKHYQTITCLKFTPCGFYLVSGGQDGLVLRWNMSHIIDSMHSSDAPDPHVKLGQHSDQVRMNSFVFN